MTMDWTLRRQDSGRLALVRAGVAIEVQVAACFPWSEPDALIALRDDTGHEQAFIEDLGALPSEIRALVQEELRQRNFVPRIVRIDRISDEVELFAWHVQTDAGARGFLTKRQDPLRRLPGGAVLVCDIDNDLYLIPDPKRLDARSLKLLWVYLD